MSDLENSLLQAVAHLDDFRNPEHSDAVKLWPILLPLYGAHLMAERSLEQLGFAREANLCGRVAEALRDTMIDAELGLRKATPEQRAAYEESTGGING